MHLEQSQTYQQVKPFALYTLSQFEYVQLISKSKHTVCSYKHIETNITYIVKEVPFQETTIVKYRFLHKIHKIHKINLLPILGMSIIRRNKIRFQKYIENYRLKSDVHFDKDTDDTKEKHQDQHESHKSQKQHSNSSASILIFMEKYEYTLQKYINNRRLLNKAFTRQQINIFLMQMLSTLQKLQKQKIAHRDIKPDNILYNKGSYFLCDFDEIMLWDGFEQVELTTVEYSSPQFLRFIRKIKNKIFDPFKLDVYSLGLTLLYMCSMGKFHLEERNQYLYEDHSTTHFDFIQEQRKKYVRQNPTYKSFNSLIKAMLEEDQYKRDDFIIMMIKLKNNQEGSTKELSVFSLSVDDAHSQNKSSNKLKKTKKKQKNIKQRIQLNKYQKVYGAMNLILIAVFIILCIS